MSETTTKPPCPCVARGPRVGPRHSARPGSKPHRPTRSPRPCLHPRTHGRQAYGGSAGGESLRRLDREGTGTRAAPSCRSNNITSDNTVWPFRSWRAARRLNACSMQIRLCGRPPTDERSRGGPGAGRPEAARKSQRTTTRHGAYGRRAHATSNVDSARRQRVKVRVLSGTGAERRGDFMRPTSPPVQLGMQDPLGTSENIRDEPYGSLRSYGRPHAVLRVPAGWGMASRAAS